MSRGARTTLGSPTAALLLLVALLPSLLYVGHWQLPVDFSLPIPGTGYALGTADAVVHQHDHGDHGDHCHGDSDGCSQSPVSPQAPALNLREHAVAIGLGTLAFMALAASWRPTLEQHVGPAKLPPRAKATS